MRMRFIKAHLIFKRYLAAMAFLFFGNLVYAQDTLSREFGKVTLADFRQGTSSMDTGASALILMDIGKTYFDLSRSAFANYDAVYTRFTRIKILDKRGIKSGTFEIPLRIIRLKIGESITDLRGTTYNLENGNIVASKLEESSIYTDNFNQYFSIKKFSMPELKAGSVFELTYTIRTAFTSIRSWNFQYEYPCLWSEYEVDLNSNMNYRVTTKGSLPFYISTSAIGKDKTQQYRWVKKDVAALVHEDYVSSMKNFIESVSFRYGSFNIKNDRDNRQAWEKISEDFLLRNELNENAEYTNPWIDSELGKIVGNETDKKKIARKIYTYVRDNFNCVNHNAVSARHTLKQIFDNRAGSEVEINLLLMMFLRHEKIIAYPAVMSTRENGYSELEYPFMEEYNYLVCVVYEEGQEIPLDASRPHLAYGRLLDDCYNGGMRILNESDPKLVRMTPDSLLEKEVTNLFIVNDDKGLFTGSVTITYGINKSYAIREEVRKNSKKEYFSKKLVSDFEGLSIQNPDFDGLDDEETPLVMHYDLDFNDFQKLKVIYFNPFKGTSFIRNPFVSPERVYPVEFPYKQDHIILVSMDIPKGFLVDELPKSTRIKLNENQGLFEYVVQQNPDNIQMQIRLRLNKTVFPPEDYTSLREFFNDVVKKESEQIVFKRVQ